jgi:hypothetical protein
MKHTIRIVALLGAIMVIAALGVTAFAAGSGTPSPAPVTRVSPSDDPTPATVGRRRPGSAPRQLRRGRARERLECQSGAMADDDSSGPGSSDDAEDNSAERQLRPQQRRRG